MPFGSLKANTVEETATALVDIDHKWRIYSDGGCDHVTATGQRASGGRPGMERRSTWSKTTVRLQKLAICADQWSLRLRLYGGWEPSGGPTRQTSCVG